ncbi:sensor histidine kinase [uncultured Kordia sp.]|uniref:ATP-binding protein n=1 Tax=uncultured Kordia sp. TaxID=507699 RepID=UPI00261C4E73|nr:sensor histidine kinase [uncultured Kordia sp.]
MQKKIIFITSFLFINIFCVWGQSVSTVDSMQQLLVTQKGINRIETLNELAWELKKSKDSVGIKYAEEALKLSKQQGYYKGISDAYSRLGTIALRRKNNADTKKYYLKALANDEEHKYLYGIARAKNQLGIIYKREKKYKKALEYFLFSLDVIESRKQYKQASQIAANIGNLYFKDRAYTKAFNYFTKQLEYSKLANDSIYIAKSYRNIGDVQKVLKNYKQALISYLKAEEKFIEKNKTKESANIMIDIATIYDYLNQNKLSKEKFINTLKFIQKSKKGDRGALYFNFGTLYRKLGQLDSASYYYQKAENFFIKANNKQKLLVYYNNIGNKFYDYQSYDKALLYFNKSLQLQGIVKDTAMLLNTYKSISRVYRKLKDYRVALIFSDSTSLIREVEFQKIKEADQYQVVAANFERELVASENQKIIIENQKEIAENKAEKQTILISSLCIALMLLLGLFFYITKARKQRQQRELAEADLKQQKLIAEHEKAQQEQHLQELIKTQEMNAINAMISGQEEERKRIAQDLHDNLGSKLSLVKIHYQSVEDNLESIDEDAKTQYEKANQLLDEACKSVREISHNMISGTLSKFGLIPALKELKQTLENVYSKQVQYAIHIELTYHKLDNRLENTMEIQIYRIIQELLNNIIKHAKATQVDIQILKLEKGVNIIVEDDGVGFDTEKQHKGIGLKTIQSRVVNMKGSCLIDSGKGNGTTVTIDIPT